MVARSKVGNVHEYRPRDGHQSRYEYLDDDGV